MCLSVLKKLFTYKFYSLQLNDGTPNQGPKGNKPKEETKTDLEGVPKPSLIGEIEFDDDDENKEGQVGGEEKVAGEEEKKGEEVVENTKNEQGLDNEEDDVALI